MMVQTFKVWRRNEFKLLYDPESLIRCFTLLSKENLNLHLLALSAPTIITLLSQWAKKFLKSPGQKNS